MITPINGAAPEQQFAPVLAALATMQGNVEREQKHQATEFLEQFQKSPEAWTTAHAILQAENASVEAKLFAATTLKGKITYDILQLPRDALVPLRNSLLSILVSYRTGARPIRTQLCVCLAGLALQMLEWKDVISLVVSTLGSDPESSVCLLEFLTILPEEVTEGRKVNLTEEELKDRTQELLTDNAPQVLNLLVQYAQSTANSPPNPSLITCLNSWLREIPCSDVVKTPLLDVVIAALSEGSAFDEAIDCLCTMFRETREVDESQDVIQALYPRVQSLRPKIAEVAETDPEEFKGYTRLFAEAGEAWVVLIARLPQQFRGLVEAIAECAARDSERDVIHLTFNFWYELKNYLVLEKYIEARVQLANIFAGLVDVMIKHLEYPKGHDNDLFDGNKETEEKFREFRHSMGDVLKDCCEVIGSADCLAKALTLIEAWMQNYISRTPIGATGHVENWQELEAPLFSLRAMGRMVPADEEQVLPKIMASLVQLPEHEKVRFAATLVLGRYTEWTSKHPEYLQLQLNYITSGFQHSSKDVARAAAMALKFFCQDCGKLLVDHVTQLHQFYEHVAGDLPLQSLYEVTDGVAHVVAAQPLEKIYETLRLFCEPIAKRLMEKANTAHDDKLKCELADHIQLLTIFVQVVHPHVPPGQANPMIRFWSEVFPILSAILENFVNFLPICERISRCFRAMLISYRTDMLPLLPQMADKLVFCFEKSTQGCFLWVTGAVIREFADDEFVDEATRNSVYQFLERQCLTMFRIMNNTSPKEMPDVIEDFFRLLVDGVMFHPAKIITSNLLQPIFEASLASLELEQVDPLIAVLQFLRDVLAYGRPAPPTSTYQETTPAEVQAAVKNMSLSIGERITQKILSGLMYSFPRDCVPDSSGVLLALVELCPQPWIQWMKRTLEMLPAGSVSPAEAQKFLTTIEGAVQTNDWKKIRYTLQDFTNWYRRKNVTPRTTVTGIEGIEGSQFRFSG